MYDTYVLTKKVDTYNIEQAHDDDYNDDLFFCMTYLTNQDIMNFLNLFAQILFYTRKTYYSGNNNVKTIHLLNDTSDDKKMSLVLEFYVWQV